MKPYQQQTYYELLEVPVTATSEEIRAAYRRATELYSEESVAMYALGDAGQANQLRAMLLEAMEMLTDRDLRLEYDKSLGIERPLPPPPAPPEPRDEPSPQLTMTDLLASADAVHSTLPGYQVSYLPRPPPSPPSLGQFISLVEQQSTRAPEFAEPPPPRVVERAEAPSSSAEPASRLDAAGPDSTETPRAAAPPVPSAESVAPPVETAAVETPVLSEPEPGSDRADHAAPPGGLPEEPRVRTEEQVALFDQPASREPAFDAARPASLVSVPDVPVSKSTRPSLGEAQLLAQESAIANAETQERRPPPAPPPSRPKLDIPPDAEFNGELLRRVRENRGQSTQALAEKTRISRTHIENIEADKYDGLPVNVYLRGILMNLAKELGLDPLRVAKSYLALVGVRKGK